MAKKTYQKPLHVDVPFDEALERFAQVDPTELEAVGDNGRVRIIEDEDTGDRLAIYRTAQGLHVEAHYDGKELRMTQAQMSELFGRDQSVIARHLKRIEQMDGLPPDTLYAESAYKAPNGQTYHRRLYTIDAINYVGFRVNSPQGILFRRWASDTLGQILTKGFYIDKRKLKGAPDRFAELREIIRDIRTDEANVYAELRRICSMCSDYDSKSNAAHRFYAHMQAKLYWAVVSHTPSEMLRDRVDADAPNLGLQTWAGDKILQDDATNAKNTLMGAELKELNRVHDILLSVFEDQLDVGRLTTMKDAERLLDEQLAQLGRPVLKHGGSISSDDAKAHAKAQYKIFDQRRRLARKARADAELAELKKTANETKPKKVGKKG